MHEWVPVSTSARGRLARGALDAFGARGYDGVGVVELATEVGVTTGSLYHHFGSKLGLYGVVRDDVERRVLDRMHGAVAALAPNGIAPAVRAALLVAFDYATEAGFARLLGEPDPRKGSDAVETYLSGVIDAGRIPIGAILAAAWRASLLAVAGGVPADQARRALAALGIDVPTLGIDGP